MTDETMEKVVGFLMAAVVLFVCSIPLMAARAFGAEAGADEMIDRFEACAMLDRSAAECANLIRNGENQ